MQGAIGGSPVTQHRWGGCVVFCWVPCWALPDAGGNFLWGRLPARCASPRLLTASRRGQIALRVLPSHVLEADLAPTWARHSNSKNARTEVLIPI